ncbi:MAG: hypothetical protein N3A59_09215 [Thermodesulfovibrionales bacterium]|nr:hypothetical protein [Thermodesulfovibrionales bacterium]
MGIKREKSNIEGKIKSLCTKEKLSSGVFQKVAVTEIVKMAAKACISRV